MYLASELTSAVLTDTVTASTINAQAFTFDAAGNRTGVQTGNTVATEASNNLNQLTATTGGGPMRFAGTVSKPASVTVGGNAATVRADGSYEGWAAVAGMGTTTVPIVAKDSSGNVTNDYVNVTPGALAAQSFGYDQNGNQTAAGPSGGQVTYGWDAADRLVTITQGGNVTRFDYDGQSRRVRESLNGAEVRHWVWAGLSLAEERNPSNAVTKRFFGQGEQIAGTSYFYTRDHLGSVRELVDGSQTVRARYAYDPYGVRSANQVTSNPVEADFGFTGHYFHQPSGLYLALYREYNAQTARWLSRDPIGENGGINLYGYVGNMPIESADAFGLEQNGGAEHWYNPLSWYGFHNAWGWLPLPEFDAPGIIRGNSPVLDTISQFVLGGGVPVGVDQNYLDDIHSLASCPNDNNANSGDPEHHNAFWDPVLNQDFGKLLLYGDYTLATGGYLMDSQGNYYDYYGFGGGNNWILSHIGINLIGNSFSMGTYTPEMQANH